MPSNMQAVNVQRKMFLKYVENSDIQYSNLIDLNNCFNFTNTDLLVLFYQWFYYCKRSRYLSKMSNFDTMYRDT